MLRKIVLSLLTILTFVQQLPPLGTHAGTKIYNGGDNGIQGVADSDGDVVLSYGTTLFDKVNITCNLTEVVVSSGFAIAPLREISSPIYVLIGEKNYILYEVCNLANTTDRFKIEITTSLPSGWKVDLIDDNNQDKIHQVEETILFDTIDIPADTTHYFFILIDISSDVNYGMSTNIVLTVKNQNGLGTNDNWYDDDVRVVTFTAIAISPQVRSNIPIPTGLKIFKTTDAVTLSWDVVEYPELDKFLVYKADSIETLCRTTLPEYYASTSTTFFIDKSIPNYKTWYKIKSVDKYFNMSEDSMFISSDGDIVSVCYENKILAMIITSQYNKVLYKETNNINANLHIKITKVDTNNSLTDLAMFNIECFKNGVLLNRINNMIDLNSKQTILKIYYDFNMIKEKTGEENLQRVSMLYYNNIEWITIGGVPVDNFFTNNISFNGKYKLAVIPKTRQFEIIGMTPKKFYSPLEPPPLDKFRVILKHRKTVKPVGKIFDLTGTEIKHLTAETVQEGEEFTTTEFVWDGKDNNNNPVRSGIYIYQFESNDGVINGSIILVK